MASPARQPWVKLGGVRVAARARAHLPGRCCPRCPARRRAESARPPPGPTGTATRCWPPAGESQGPGRCRPQGAAPPRQPPPRARGRGAGSWCRARRTRSGTPPLGAQRAGPLAGLHRTHTGERAPLCPPFPVCCCLSLSNSTMHAEICAVRQGAHRCRTALSLEPCRHRLGAAAPPTRARCCPQSLLARTITRGALLWCKRTACRHGPARTRA